MNERGKWVVLSLLALIGLSLLPLPSVKAGEIEAISFPPENLGVVSTGSIVELRFGATFLEVVRSMALIDVNYSEMAFLFENFNVTLNDCDISDQFTISVKRGRILLNCSSLTPANGTLLICLKFKAGFLSGNYTFRWRYIYISYQSPPNYPTVVDESGASRVRVIFGTRVSFFEGWNLIGIPLNPANPSIENLFGDNLSKVDYIFGWDNEYKSWEYWISGMSSSYQTIKELEPGKGYWIYVSENFTQWIFFSLPSFHNITQPGLNGTIFIGDIASSTNQFEFELPFVNNIIIPDLNEYARKLGYNITFTFVLEDAQGQAAVHLEKVQGLHAMGVDLIIGGRWSSQAQSALSYINENNILLFSPSSTSPLLAIPEDNLFRMCPNDQVQGSTIAEMLWSWGIEAVIVIQRGDPWADSIYNIFEKEYPKLGGEILARVRYAAEVTEFSSYLEQMEEVAKEAVEKYGAEHVGVLALSFSEIVTIITQTKDYPTIYNLIWFGSDGTALCHQVIDDAPEHGDHLKLLSPLAAPEPSEKWENFYERYYEILNKPPSYYDGCTYDIAFAIAKAVLLTQSTDPSDVIRVLPLVCDDTYGVTGWCKLNEAGDRAGSNYDIWGVAIVDGKALWARYGYYDYATGKIYWFEQGIASDGTRVPGLHPPGHS